MRTTKAILESKVNLLNSITGKKFVVSYFNNTQKLELTTFHNGKIAISECGNKSEIANCINSIVNSLSQIKMQEVQP